MSKYYKIHKSLGKVSAFETDSIPQKGVCIEVEFHNYLLYFLIHKDGEFKDLNINNWTFPCVYNSVRYKYGEDIYGGRYDYDINFEVVDPTGTIHNIVYKPLYGSTFLQALEYFYTLLYNMSCCESFEQYQQLYKYIIDNSWDTKGNFAVEVLNFINSFAPRFSKLIDTEYSDRLKLVIETKYKEAQGIIAASSCPT